jgi:UDP-glucose/iron transport system ATP-binding protein
LESPPLFGFDHVTVTGALRPRLDDATGELPEHGVTVVVGPSGAGKSTLLRLCNRLDVPDRGTVRFRDADVGTLDPLALRRRVGMVFQRPTPFAGTVRDNLLVAEPGITDADAVAAIQRVGLDGDVLTRDATRLSGGEAQRVCLARTLVTQPEVVLMDEPASSLDPAARHGLEDLALSLAASGVPVVWVTHDLTQMRRIADHVVVVMAGRIVHAAPADRLEVDAPEAVRAFLQGIPA